MGVSLRGSRPGERAAARLLAALPPAVVADGLAVELNPGDALLIPAGWFHELESLPRWALSCLSV